MMAYESRLFRAVHKGDMETIQLLVSKKVDLNKIENGHSALSLAIFCKNTSAVKLLLAAGNVNVFCYVHTSFANVPFQHYFNQS